MKATKLNINFFLSRNKLTSLIKKKLKNKSNDPIHVLVNKFFCIHLTGISNGKFLKEIATKCVQLDTLWLAYVGLGPQIPGIWDSLKFFKNLLDLR
jgi:hypothetical protein